METYADRLKRLGEKLDENFKANLLDVAREVHRLAWLLAVEAGQHEAEDAADMGHSHAGTNQAPSPVRSH